MLRDFHEIEYLIIARLNAILLYEILEGRRRSLNVRIRGRSYLNALTIMTQKKSFKYPATLAVFKYSKQNVEPEYKLFDLFGRMVTTGDTCRG